MAIVASDIVKRFSATAATGDGTVGTAATSLGGKISSTVITDATIGNLFNSDVTGAESASGAVKYRCVFVLNNHATLTLVSAQVAIASQTASGSAVTIALDNIAVSAKGSSSAQAATIATETTAPSGVGAFGAGPLAIGDIAPGQVKAVWIKQDTTAGTAALNLDGVVLRFSGDTAA